MRTRSRVIVLPPLRLRSSKGRERDLASRGDPAAMVLIFVPELNASLPTLEPFEKRLNEFLAASSVVCVIANEEPDELRRFAESHELDVELLSDAERSLSAELNLGSACRPVVLLTDRDGVVRESIGYPNIHVDGVLDCVRRLNAA